MRVFLVVGGSAPREANPSCEILQHRCENVVEEFRSSASRAEDYRWSSIRCWTGKALEDEPLTMDLDSDQMADKIANEA